MTNPKTAESRVTVGRPKAAAAPAAKTDKPVVTKSAKDVSAEAGPAHNGQNPMLDQLVALTRSIGDLVQQNVGASDGADPDPDAAERTRVVFAYDFLGVVLGRRAPSVFQLKTVTVERDFGTLTFTGLAGATAAKIRAADNTVKVLEGLRDGDAVTIDRDPNAITDDQRIDSIVTFTALGGTPVGIGPCLGPVGGVVG
ncbi:hypothetical protein ACIA5G_44815 [Amycolatopsis sp. NPDC051758]|uniref:hypothetical protein n=1 Tax=Amycolatopsis sp. NPDC051758 TaxID=3363935 RepID=UPI0037AC5089